jgi:putative FmdB family regulatory protein
LPRYDYECDSCHHRFELKQSFDSEPVATCPSCEGNSRRKFHAVPIVFKGSGWYVNDYGKRNGSTSAPAEAKESEKKSSKAESKSGGEAKPESKAKTGAKAESTSA